MQQPTSASQSNLVRKIAKWKAGLSDLGRKNPLIKFRKDNLRSLEVLVEAPNDLFKFLLERKKPVYFLLTDDEFLGGLLIRENQLPLISKGFMELQTSQKGNDQLKRLKKLRAEARRSLEEKGVNSLFLTFGTLTWHDKDKPDDVLLSPLILVPVELLKEPKKDLYSIRVLEEEVVLNPTLALKLKQTFGIDFPEGDALQEVAYGELITQIRLLLSPQRAWEVKDDVFLSLFSYAKAAMVRDIIENEARIFAHPILQAVSGDLTAYQSNYQEPLPASALDAQVRPEKIFQILDADSSQQVVIEAAKTGSSFVVEGPPGTGKSQTIVNMIAELIGSGKSVLLVAEKETALSVVYKRMSECGLAHLCLNLHHSSTTDKRKLIQDLSNTIKYVEHFAQNNNGGSQDQFFGQLVSTRLSLSSYLVSLHTKEKPLDKSPYELFGELLRAKREAIPDLKVTFSSFNSWTPIRLQEARDLLNQLAQFLSFFNGQKTTVWAKSSLSSYSYELELELRDKVEDFSQAIASAQKISDQLQTILNAQPFSSLESLENFYPVLSHISKAPSQVPEKWTTVNIALARDALTTLASDIREIEEKQPSQEASDLLEQLSSFLPFLKGEMTTIWKKSRLQFCSEAQELELNRRVDGFRGAISLVQPTIQRLQVLLEIEPLVNLEEIEILLPTLDHILNAPVKLPDNWSELDRVTARNAFDKLSQDINFLEDNELPLKQKYRLEIFSSELAALNSRFQRYSRFWFIRIFNPNYRRDVKRLRKLVIQEEKISHDELKRDLAQSLQVQSKRNELYQSNYVANQVFGSLFNPEFSNKTELGQIQQVLSWLDEPGYISAITASIESDLNSPTFRSELADTVRVLKDFSENFRREMKFLFLHFDATDISGLNLPFNQILFSDLILFLSLAVADLPKLRKWLAFKNVYSRLESLGCQEFISALREDRPDPIVTLQNKIAHTDYLPHRVFGSLFNPKIARQSELKPMEEAVDWLSLFQRFPLPADSVQQVLDSPSQRREIAEILRNLELSYEDIKQGLDFLLLHFNESHITDTYLPCKQIPFAELIAFLNITQADLPYFQDWLTYKAAYERLENLGITKFLDALRDSNLDPEYWYSVLEKLIYQTCLNAILAIKPELKNFNVEVHQRQLQEFARLDHNQLDVARERLKQQHTKSWQGWEKASVAQAELPRLKREATKKRQHLSIRRLLNDKQKGVPNLVKALKPCWMMSPLSVSQYIDPDVIHFDVLIFDEASQLRTEDVVSSIIRSEQVIVIGDRKQLPPTSFFSSGESEEEDEELADEDYGSVLDECSSFMLARTLKWHYRSQDERLIAFSNLHFYDSQLVTFPNPVQNPELGVWFNHVSDGIYDRGGRRDNRREAELVAQLALNHIQQVPDQSLGIIAFSEAQADAIQEQIEILGRDYAELEAFCRDNSPQFFLKALENVQGDERDVILLSVGYARDSQGKLSLNFGPLNKKGGERRLNVAVTRAKSKITLISSILAGDINLTSAKSEGVIVLRDYLEYAASGGKILQGNSYTDQLQFDSPFEEDVYHTLVHHSLLEQEYTVRTQVGCSGYRIDLAVAHNDRPGAFLLGIECDGASYHSSPTARDRDRLRQQVLEKLGWKIHRIWSTDWFRNKPEQVRLLVEKIKRL